MFAPPVINLVKLYSIILPLPVQFVLVGLL